MKELPSVIESPLCIVFDKSFDKDDVITYDLHEGIEFFVKQVFPYSNGYLHVLEPKINTILRLEIDPRILSKGIQFVKTMSILRK